MKKTIIALHGTANVGKSMTLSTLGRLLVADGGELISANGRNEIPTNTTEYHAFIRFRNSVVGIQTFGDTLPLKRNGV